MTCDAHGAPTSRDAFRPLPQMNPVSTEASTPKETTLQHIIESIDAITGLEPVWKHGLVHRGGPHYRLTGSTGPVSIGEDECLLLGTLIRRFRPNTCFVIGNGFGLSSAFIAAMMEANGGTSVITLDSKTEGEGERCFQTAEQLNVRLGCRILRNEQGRSPKDIEKAIGERLLDLTLIDGDHSHPQATRDFLEVQHFIAEQGIVCWHDFWLPGVARSVEKAKRQGYRCLQVNTSCEMILGTKDQRIYRELQLLFETAQPPHRRRHPLARLRLSGSYWWSRIQAGLPPKA